MKDKGKYYQDGFNNGRLDKLLGHTSVIALTSPNYNLPGYADGYKDGQNYKEEVIVKEGRLVDSFSHGGGRIIELLVMGGFTVRYSRVEITYRSLDEAREWGLKFISDSGNEYL